MTYYALFAHNEGNESNARPFARDVYRISDVFTYKDVQGT